MKTGKFHLLLLGVSLCSFGDVGIRFFEQNESLVVARVAGTVDQQLVSMDDVVNTGDVILILQDDGIRHSVAAKSDGLFKEYANSITEGAVVEKGDVVAILNSSDVKGVMTTTADHLLPTSSKAGDVYCCLTVEDQEFRLNIVKMTQHNGRQLMYFAINDAPALARLLRGKSKDGLKISLEVLSNDDEIDSVSVVLAQRGLSHNLHLN